MSLLVKPIVFILCAEIISCYSNCKTTLESDLCQPEDFAPTILCSCQDGTPPKKIVCYLTTIIMPDDLKWCFFSKHTQNLEKLFISGLRKEYLSYIPSATLIQLTNLKELKISNGLISNIHSLAFPNLPKLEILNLKQNNIKTIVPLALNGLPNVVEINLGNNALFQIRQGVFNTPNLQILNLSNNTIRVVDVNAFVALNKLVDLNLSGNLITIVSSETFQGLNRLKKLNLSNNSIEKIEDKTFDYLWSLEILYLDRNQISKISKRAFFGLAQLKKLFLNLNFISTLPDGVFTYVPCISYLNLQGNKLKIISQETFKPIWKNVVAPTGYLNILGNNLDCNFSNEWLFKLRDGTKNITTRGIIYKIPCSRKIVFSSSTSESAEKCWDYVMVLLCIFIALRSIF